MYGEKYITVPCSMKFLGGKFLEILEKADNSENKFPNIIVNLMAGGTTQGSQAIA